jgi:hypothetical protein
MASSGLSEEDTRSLGERREIGLAAAGAMARVCRTKAPIVVDDAHPLAAKSRLKPPYSAIRALRTKSFAAVPITARGRLLGVLVADNKYCKDSVPFETLQLLPLFALHLATAVDNASLLNELQTRERELAGSFLHDLPPRPEQSLSPLERDHDLAEVLPALQVAKCIGPFLERQRAVDDRPQFVLRDRAIHRFEASARADRNALHTDHRPYERPNRNGGLISGHEADHADESAEG